MNVLVIHDRPSVAERISDIIREVAPALARLDVVRDTFAARGLLNERHYDLAIVDLTLPLMDGGTPGYEAAEHLLQELVWSDTASTPGDVVGITIEETMIGRIHSTLGPHLMAVIREDPEGEWEKGLRDRINYVARSGRARLRSLSTIYDFDVLIVTALDEEFAPFFDLLALKAMPDYRGAYSFSFADRAGHPRRGVIFSVGWAGQGSCAAATEGLISRFRPRVAIMAGICGGLKKKTKLAQVYAFQAVWDWDSGKWSTATEGPLFLSRPEPLNVRGRPVHDAFRSLIQSGLAEHARVLGEASSLNRKVRSIEIDFAAAASGSAVIASLPVATQIGGHADNIKVIDMESYGFYTSCSHTRAVAPDFICIKSVCDFADEKKDDSFHAVAAHLSAAVTVDLLLYHIEY